MIQALDGLMIDEGVGVFYLNDQACVQACNKAARNLLEKSSVLAISDGKLVVNDPEKSKEFCHRVKFKSTYDGKESLLVRRAKSAYPLKLSLFPLKDLPNDADVENLVIVLARDTSIKPKFMATGFTEFYKLTDAEKALSQSLYDGLSLREHSEKRGVKITTTRWTLNNLFSKTFTRSQLELQGLFNSFTD